MRVQLPLAGLLGLSQAQSGPNYPANNFNQLIDHFPDSPRYKLHPNGTFTQRFFFDSTYYKSGGPVFLLIGGEVRAEYNFETMRTGLIQILMQATNGLGVVLENRYYGRSYPYRNSSTDNLAFLTTEQTIADNAYFAQHVKFPGVNEDLTAPKTPWIVYGSSLAGAQTAFTQKTYSDILWGAIAGSGVIKPVVGYSQWYAPIQKYGPQDCVASINALVDKIDTVFMSGNAKAIHELKSIFGLEVLADNRDFATVINFPIGNPGFYEGNSWQELNWSPRYGSQDFFYFCNNVTNLNASENITRIDNYLSKYTNGETWKNLGNYANYIKQVVLPYCPSGKYDSHIPCFNTQTPKWWARTDNTEIRSYLYTACSEQGLYIAAPKKGPSLLSRVVQTDYWQQWCVWAFPAGKYNSIPEAPDLNRYLKYGGFNFSAPRLAFVDGSADPWLDACYHSTDAPARYWSEDHPELLIPGTGHHWDSYGIIPHSKEPQFIQMAHEFETRTVQRWLIEFRKLHKS